MRLMAKPNGANGLPPGPRAPSALQLLRWIYTPIPFIRECERRFGDWFTVRFPGYAPLTFTTDPVAIREIFSDTGESMHAGQVNVILKPLLGEHSLLILDGQRHLRERKMMLPAFHGERMRVYGDVMKEVAEQASSRFPVGRVFPVHPFMQQMTLDIILRTVFGLTEERPLSRLRELLTRILAFGAKPSRMFVVALWADALSDGRRPRRHWFPPLNYIGSLMDQADAILRDEFLRRRRETSGAREDVLAMLMEATDEAGERLTDAELRDEMMTLLVAGHETTATALSWVLWRLVERPDVLDRVETELRTATGGGTFDPAHAQKLDYLDAVIKETLRLNPIVPFVGRGLQRAMKVGARDLPAGTLVCPSIFLTHRRADLWPDPEQFDPERFMGKRPSPHEFFPFGGGIRRCIGMSFALFEMRIVLAQILSRYRPSRAPGYTAGVVRRSITFAPSRGMPVVMERRVA